MEGKIFEESTNIYQDQARILFNYYKNVAEKIVNEEVAIEKEISILEEEKLVLEGELSKAKTWKWVLCILILPFIYFYMKEKGLIKSINEIDLKIAEFKKVHDEIFRDYKVSKLGVAYVPIANQIKYDDKSFIVDFSEQTKDVEVKLQISKQNQLLIEKINELDSLSKEAPLVETSNETEEIETDIYSTSMQTLNQHDYFGKLNRSLKTISYCMDDLEITSVSLPLVSENSKYLNFLKEYSSDIVNSESTIVEVFDTKKYDNEISKFQELNKLKDSLSKHTEQFEDVLKNLMTTMASSVQAIATLKVASANKMVYESNNFLFKILKSPYNHYSPILEATEIERIKNETFNYSESVNDYIPFQLKSSSLVKYNLVSDSWVAEDGSSTNFPFAVHQIYEEIVAPIIQKLMNENRIERLKIYNQIRDQKISYLNKWHQDTEDFYGRNRAESADLINLMRASLRDYVAAYNTMVSLKKTEESMANSGEDLSSTVVKTEENSAEVLAAFELQSKQFQNAQIDFESYMERLKEDIDQKAEKFEHIDYYDALLRDEHFRDSALASSQIHELDERRKSLVLVNPLFAKNSELLPVPNIENITDEHFSINLPVLAENTLRELEEDLNTLEPVTEKTNSKKEKKSKEIKEVVNNKEEVEFIDDDIELINDELVEDDDVEMIDEDDEQDDDELEDDSEDDDVEMIDEDELDDDVDDDEQDDDDDIEFIDDDKPKKN